MRKKEQTIQNKKKRDETDRETHVTNVCCCNQRNMFKIA